MTNVRLYNEAADFLASAAQEQKSYKTTRAAPVARSGPYMIKGFQYKALAFLL
jgi:hypothetical protein